MRAIWKGNINFALVSIPVSLFSASRSSDISLKYLHKKDLSPVSYKRFCDREATEVAWEEVTRGYEFEKGRFVEVTHEEIREASRDLSRTIQILEFVDLREIDPIYFDKPYYLEPQKGAGHAYRLLGEALAQSGRAGIARVVLKTREHLAVVRPSGRMITMQTLRFAHEINEPDSLDLPAESSVSQKEMDLARTLIDTMKETFDPSKYTDEFRDQLLEVIRMKVAGQAPETAGAPAPSGPGPVVDLMEVLKQSLKDRKSPSPASREKTVAVGPGSGPGPARRSGKKTPSRTPKSG